MNDLSTLPARLRETAVHIREELARDPGRPLADLLKVSGLPLRDGAAVADAILPGAGAEYLS